MPFPGALAALMTGMRFLDEPRFPTIAGVPVQPLPIREEAWVNPQAYSNPRLLRNIEGEGIRL